MLTFRLAPIHVNIYTYKVRAAIFAAMGARSRAVYKIGGFP